ncbi:hypothetical protein [Endothiovibrio diazotrophicus]
MQCQCQIVNNTSTVITYAALGHSTSVPGLSGNIQKVFTVTNLGPGEASPVYPATQESDTLDFWTAVFQFEGDDKQYILANDVLPFAECETPANGAASLHVTQYIDSDTAPGSCRIDTFDSYSDGKWSGFDGSCDEQVLTPDALTNENEAEEELVELILELLGA